ncbi:ABC transporter ATP-binding protein [Lichenifustis flavocetrariae]|uniref:ABC transporter ATP-binding protein n=1 Tax=Lichenifustis flavocetrariae TaxID=2949735 RepID=A0AA41Z731_9HYPH|nr:ABC transporter ATP-binding protein [Lichenifustis flavocetrariae]MCW6510452.1 ABC transporter ATP-binding protein [Lichenifustis flavocetrariae]
MSGLDLQGLRKTFGSMEALAGVDLRVPSGSRTAIVGPSGCGKTTLLRLIAGFEQPDAGRLALDGRVLFGEGAPVPSHHRNIGVVMQDGALFPHLSVADNIGFGLSRRDPSRAGTVAGLMDLVGLPGAMRDKRPDQLSGGQQQRVALARALAREPSLMLLDEPFSALDTGLRAATREAVAALLAAKAITTVLVTHDQAEALSFADQVAVMHDGRFRQIGAPRDLYLRPKDAMVAAFLGDAILLPATVAQGKVDCALGCFAADLSTDPGPCQLMLRPEQLHVSTIAEAPAAASTGEVVGISFGGASCTIQVRLASAPDLPPLRLSVPSRAEHQIGEAVAVAVDGPVHILPIS